MKPSFVFLALLQGLAVILLLGLLLDCRNPLTEGEKSSAIDITIEGQPVGENYELRPVKQGELKALVVTLGNSGNARLKLTGTPLVQPGNPLFTITEQPAAVVEAHGSTTFTVSRKAKEYSM